MGRAGGRSAATRVAATSRSGAARGRVALEDRFMGAPGALRRQVGRVTGSIGRCRALARRLDRRRLMAAQLDAQAIGLGSPWRLPC